MPDADALLAPVLDRAGAIAFREALRAAGKRVVFTNGCFDVLHDGHTSYLAWARAQGDALILGLNGDASVRGLKGPQRPFVPFDGRAGVLAALRSVDAVVGFDESTPIDLLEALKPDVHVKSAQYRVEELPERYVVESHGGLIVLAPHLHGKSTTDLVATIRSRPVILALTANGPGEFAGWMRPLLAALYDRAPDLDVRVFCVPDDYASGHEADYVRGLFPQATVYPPGEYVKFALGRPIAGLPERVDRVLYLGGDLMHAARIHERLGGVADAYKFSRKKYARHFDRVFAVDEANRRQLLGWGIPGAAVTVVGNLVIDGALGEAAGRFGGAAESDAARDGVIFFPGSRKHEIEQVFPMFVRAALQLRRRLPDVPIAFARSPFTTDAELRAALARGGVREAYGVPSILAADGASLEAAGERFAVVRSAMRVAQRARLAVALPGTKVIELAALGVPAIVITPSNAPHLVVINGVFQYIDRVPLLGVPVKRAAVVAVAKRFTYFAQPNIDLNREVDRELRGTQLPSHIAHVAAEAYADRAWLGEAATTLRTLYAAHAGAAGRMADALLEPVTA